MPVNDPPACPPRPTLIGVPVETSLRILRSLLVSARRIICPIDTPFNPITLSRSAQVLRANRQLYYEGVNMLWEENTFWYTQSAAGSWGIKIPVQPAVFGRWTHLIKTVKTSLPLGPGLLEILKTHTSLTRLTLFMAAPGPLSLAKPWDEADFDDRLALIVQHLKGKTEYDELLQAKGKTEYDELLMLAESLKETKILVTAPGPDREGKTVITTEQLLSVERRQSELEHLAQTQHGTEHTLSADEEWEDVTEDDG